MGIRRRATKRKLDDQKVALKRANGKSISEIAREENVTPAAIFYCLQRINPKLREVLELNQYDLKKAVSKMIEMTDAKKTEFFQSNGIVLDSRVVEDNATRLQARREMLRVHGVGDTMTVEHTGTVEHVLSHREKQEAVESLKRIAQFSEGDVIDVEAEEDE